MSLNFTNGQSIKLATKDYTIKLPEGNVNFRVDETKMVIKFKDNTSIETIEEFLTSQNTFKKFDSRWLLPFPKGVMVAQLNEGNSNSYLELLANIQQNLIVQYTAPVMVYNEKTQQALYDLFYVKVRNRSDYELLKKYATSLNFEIEQEKEKDIYFCKINKQTKGNAFEVTKYLQSLNVFENVEPDFILWLQPQTNDSHYSQQWALNNTGQFTGGVSGADIDMVNAWGISTGSSSIKVAILDCFGSSSQFTHPDMSFFSTYDATGIGIPTSTPGYLNEAHGINCAGIIGATANNSIGVAGIAYNCKVVAVKMGSINSGGSYTTTNTIIASAISWASVNCDVISCSFGGGSSNTPVDNAIASSIGSGRSGKGTPFFASSGNDYSSSIGYPSSNVNAISVGASNVDDSRANFSNYSTGLDITAPGVSIYSTDIAGSAGYNTSSGSAGDYFLFNGTSAACPVAAGVMALILSAKPALYYADARKILESTCEKVGGYTYNSSVSGQPNGTWSTNLGYGRVNAYQALLKATRPDLFITASTQSVTPTTVAAGSNITVACSEDNTSYSTSAANSVTIWLSPSSTLITSNSVYLGQITGFPALAANTNSNVLNASLQIPTNTCAGTYYVFFWADGNQIVSEFNETNNFVYVPITVTSSSPTVQASNIIFSGVITNQMTVNWTNGNGTRRVVYINTSNSFTAPSNGTNPPANPAYSTPGQVVYNGTGSSVSVSGLSANTTYYFRVYEAKCSGTSSLYQTATATNNPKSQITSSSCATPSIQVSSIFFSGISTNQMIVNWANGNGSRRVVYINTSNSFTSPSNGTDQPANPTYSGSGSQPIYNGTSNSVNVSGLSSSTIYYFRIYEANCNGTSSFYQTSTATGNPNSQITPSSCSAPTSQASGISFASISTTQMTANWTSGNGSRRVVYINTSNNFSAPSNGSDPTSNTSYGGSGSQVIYNGSANNITVYGLSSSTVYYFRIYEANCSGSNSYYLSSTGTSNPNSQITSTATSCTTPTTPTPYTGYSSCIGYSLWATTSIALSWSNSGSGINYDYILTEYPYSSSNIVYAGNCISTLSAYISALTPGKLYKWNVRSTADCNTCNSPWSQSNYFQIAPVITQGNSPIYVCNGTGTTLTTPAISVASPTTVSYQWYKRVSGIDIPIGTNSTSYFVSTTGTYLLKLIYSGANVCSNSGYDTSEQSFTTFVSVASTPNTPTLSTNSPQCQGNILTLSATAPSNSQYFWTGPNGFNSSNNNLYFQNVDTNYSGTYYCYIMKDGCQSQTANISVSVNLAPIATFSTSKTGNNVTFTNTSTNATSYLWNFGNGQTSTQTSPSHTYSTNGNFNACLTANKSGCNSSSNCQLVSIGSGPNMATQPTFSKLFNDTSSTHQFWTSADFIQSPIDSGYVVIGNYQNPITTQNTLQYFKLDKNGNILWVRELPANYDAGGYQIIKSKNGYLISFSYGMGNGSALIEIDETGNKLWGKQFNATSWFYLQKVIRTNTGYVGCGIGSNGFNIAKLDSLGNFIWQKSISYSLYTSTSFEITNFLRDVNGNFYVTGYIGNGQVSPPMSTWDGIIAKLDSTGTHLWSKYYTSTTNIADVIGGIEEDSNFDIIISGYSRNWSTSPYVTNGFISKINSSGSIIASKQISNVFTNGLVKSLNNNISCLINGYSLIQLNSSLGIVNQKSFNYRSVGVIKTSFDNRFILISRQYPFNAAFNDYRYGIFKTSYNDSSCLDTSLSAITANSFSMSLSTLIPSSSTSSFTTSTFTPNPTISFLRDTSICQQCSITASIAPSGSITFCSGDSVTLTANSGMSSYLWNTSETTNSIKVKNGGNYYVTITNSYGCSTTSSPITVTVNSLPYADAGVDKSFCMGSSVSIGTGLILGNTYSWSPATSLNNSSVSNPLASPTSNTKYTLTVTNSNGCSSKDSVMVFVNPLPIANAGINKSLCLNNSVSIGSPQISGNTYNWSPTTGLNNSNISNPITTVTISTNYILLVTDTNGCNTNDTVKVTVNSLPIANVSNDKTICSDSSVSIGASTISGYTYNWLPISGLNNSTVSNPIATPMLTTKYVLMVTDSNSCSSKDSVTVSVNPLPIANAGPDKKLCLGNSITIGSTQIAGNSYSWLPTLGLSNASVSNPVTNINITTTYILTVTNTNNCIANDTVTVSVNLLPVAYVSNNKTVCSGSSVSIGASTISGYTYNWLPVSGLNNSTVSNPTATPTSTTKYALSVMDSNSCSAKDSITVSVNSLPGRIDMKPF